MGRESDGSRLPNGAPSIMPTHKIRRAAALIPGETGTALSTPIYLNSTSSTLKYVPASSGTTEVEIADVSAVQTFTNKTMTAPAEASPVITGDAGSGVVFAKTALFTEDATSLTHTATVVIPAGAILLDIIVTPQVLWTGGTAAFTCGDANAATGWFTSCNLKATDLLIGEILRASDSSQCGGVN